MCKMNKKEFEAFQSEMARLSAIKYTSYEKTLKEIGISHIAACNCSTKLMHNQQYKISLRNCLQMLKSEKRQS